jgi:hypothetical protein
MYGPDAPPTPSDAIFPVPSANLASPSDRFRYATTRTRACCPDSTRWLATITVVPPTDPVICARNIGFPVAPRASVR